MQINATFYDFFKNQFNIRAVVLGENLSPLPVFLEISCLTFDLSWAGRGVCVSSLPLFSAQLCRQSVEGCGSDGGMFTQGGSEC